MNKWFSNTANKGALVGVSLFRMLGKLCQSLMPDTRQLQYESQPESDVLIHQWSRLWSGFRMVLSRPARASERSDAAETVAARLHAIDIKSLGYTCSASAVMRILICQRNQGDPDSNNEVKYKNKSAEVPVGISAFFCFCHLSEIFRWRNSILPITTCNGV